MNRRDKLSEASKKVAYINERRSAQLQGGGQYENTRFSLLNYLQVVVDGAVGMRWVIATLFVLFIGEPDLHDAIVRWALLW